MLATGHAPDRSRLGRYVAAAAGVAALLCFYMPWVAASAPNGKMGAVSGVEVARGAAASLGLSGAGAASGRGGTLTLPTRIPTVAPGTTPPAAGTAAAAAGGGSGALPAPVRTLTPAPTTGGASTSGSTSAGGLTLPTRIPTVAPGAGPAIATAAAATAVAVATVRASGGTVQVTTETRQQVEHLPTTPVYGLPLAAAGVAIFAAIWGRLREPRDRLYGQLWTVLLSAGGTLGAGYLLTKVVSASHPNDLLNGGEVRGALWGLWLTFLSFLISAVALAVAWLGPKSRPEARVAPARSSASLEPAEV